MRDDALPVVLATPDLRVEVLPALGGRVQSLVDRRREREWMWRPPTQPAAASSVGDEYDERWQGGFEELFPNDAPTTLDGRELPDHGELWPVSWEVVEHEDGQRLALRTVGEVTGVEVAKEFRVEGPELHVAYELRGDLDRPLHYLFKLHAAVAVDGASRLELPGGELEPVDPEFGTILPGAGRWPWPGPDGADVSVCRPPTSGHREFVYVHDLPEGWCGVRDDRRRARLRLEYPREIFPFCWFFLTYGGWRDHQVAVLEPCTNYPKDLGTAVASGTSALLPAGPASTSFAVTFRVEELDV